MWKDKLKRSSTVLEVSSMGDIVLVSPKPPVRGKAAPGNNGASVLYVAPGDTAVLSNEEQVALSRRIVEFIQKEIKL
jgi:hypothetical protein